MTENNNPEDDFFIGWADTPKTDRRFFLNAGLGLMAGSAAIASGVALLQRPPGPGTWDQAAIREWRGAVTNEPYAMLRTNDLDGSPRTALLSCLGKCGVGAQIGALTGQPVVVTGSLIQRGQHAMIAVNELGEWIRVDTGATLPPQLVFGVYQPLGPVSLKGEILDSKCWIGAMRPSESKVHKACAALCIRGGLPPAFLARDRDHRDALLIMTNNGRACGEDILPFVADPLSVTGVVTRRDDVLYLDASTDKFARIK